MIEGSSNFMSGSSSWYVTSLPSLVVLGIVGIIGIVGVSLSRDQTRARN